MTDNVHFMSKTVECLTPKHILDAVIEVMGGISLDPCAETHDNPNVPAYRHYTKEDDGLTKPWYGQIYMNPPYGYAIRKWVDKLSREYHHLEHVQEAIALLPARTDTKWFKVIQWRPVCFVRGRLKFSGAENSAPFPSAIFYFGQNEEKFKDVFWKFGSIWKCVIG